MVNVHFLVPAVLADFYDFNIDGEPYSSNYYGYLAETYLNLELRIYGSGTDYTTTYADLHIQYNGNPNDYWNYEYDDGRSIIPYWWGRAPQSSSWSNSEQPLLNITKSCEEDYSAEIYITGPEATAYSTSLSKSSILRAAISQYNSIRPESKQIIVDGSYPSGNMSVGGTEIFNCLLSFGDAISSDDNNRYVLYAYFYIKVTVGSYVDGKGYTLTCKLTEDTAHNPSVGMSLNEYDSDYNNFTMCPLIALFSMLVEDWENY